MVGLASDSSRPSRTWLHPQECDSILAGGPRGVQADENRGCSLGLPRGARTTAKDHSEHGTASPEAGERLRTTVASRAPSAVGNLGSHTWQTTRSSSHAARAARLWLTFNQNNLLWPQFDVAMDEVLEAAQPGVTIEVSLTPFAQPAVSHSRARVIPTSHYKLGFLNHYEARGLHRES